MFLANPCKRNIQLLGIQKVKESGIPFSFGCRSTGVDKWNEVNTHNLSMLIQFPIKLGIFPDNSLPSIRLQQRMIQMNTLAQKN